MSVASIPSRLAKSVLQRYFAFREAALIAGAGELKTPPIFIVGPPRSGTTLLYQVITNCLQTSYFCNFASWHAHTPAAATQFTRAAIKDYVSAYRSDYGEVPGRGGPAEAELIWKGWFGRDRTDGKDLTVAQSAQMNATIAAVQKLLGGPFVAKDISNALRVRALAKVFPEALFVRVSRDPFAIALSILKARHGYREERGFETTDNPIDEWVFINSKDFEPFYELPYLEQIANQVFHTEKILEEDLASVSSDRCIRISYQDFCVDPRAQIQRLSAFAAEHGAPLQAKAELPEKFAVSVRSEESLTDEQKQLRAHLEVAYGDWSNETSQ
jgi:hypothetical protein